MNRSTDDVSGIEATDGPPPEPLTLPNDPVALGQALESYRTYLLRVASQEIDASLKPKGGASDIVQETFLDAQRDLDRFAGRSERELKNWLRQILLNNLANFIRRYRKSRKRQVGREVPLETTSPGGPRTFDLAASDLTPSGQAIQHEQAADLERALARLKERDRLVLVWRSQEQSSWEEIGQRLGGSPDMARKAWIRAVERLRDEVGDLPEPPSQNTTPP